MHARTVRVVRGSTHPGIMKRWANESSYKLLLWPRRSGHNSNSFILNQGSRALTRLLQNTRWKHSAIDFTSQGGVRHRKLNIYATTDLLSTAHSRTDLEQYGQLKLNRQARLPGWRLLRYIPDQLRRQNTCLPSSLSHSSHLLNSFEIHHEGLRSDERLLLSNHHWTQLPRVLWRLPTQLPWQLKVECRRLWHYLQRRQRL